MEDDKDIQALQERARRRIEEMGPFSGKVDILAELRHLDEQAAYLRERLLAIISDDVTVSALCAKKIKRQHDLLIRFLILRDIVFGNAD